MYTYDFDPSSPPSIDMGRSSESLNFTQPPENRPLKTVIGALSWAEFQISGVHTDAPKESAASQNSPTKAVLQTTDATPCSGKQTSSALKYGKDFLPLKD